MKYISFKQMLITAALIAVTLYSCSAFAFNAREFCHGEAELAASVMQNRQAGISLDKVLDFNATLPDKSVRDAHRMFVDMAYKRPVFQHPDNCRMAVNDFRDAIYSACLNIMER